MQLTTLSALAATAAVGFVAGRATLALPTTERLQEPDPAPAQEGAAPAMDPELAAWIEAGTPGEHHRPLDPFVGTWDGTLEMWSEPGAEPMTSTGKMVNAWVFDGRYLQQDWSGDFLGQPFTGRGYWGYSNLEGTYQGIWMDSMSTGIAYQAGWVEDDGDKFVMIGKEIDPVSGEEIDVRVEIDVLGPDQHTYSRIVTLGEGQEPFTGMKITYERSGR